jgi:hypothetical protein
MKLHIILLCALLAGHAFALDIVSGSAVFRDCTQIRTAGAELFFKHESGSAHIRYDKLPEAVAKKYFTPQQIAAFAKQEAYAAEARRITEANRDAAARKEYEQHKQAMEHKAVAAAIALAKKRDEDASRAEIAAKASAAEEKRKLEKSERIANYQSGKWERFGARMIGPSATGQIMAKPDGMVIHVIGDLGLAQGEKYEGYFVRDGNYSYTAAAGGSSRVQNFRLCGSATQEIDDDYLAYARFKLEVTRAKVAGTTFPLEKFKEIVHVEMRLKESGREFTKIRF